MHASEGVGERGAADTPVCGAVSGDSGTRVARALGRWRVGDARAYTSDIVFSIKGFFTSTKYSQVHLPVQRVVYIERAVCCVTRVCGVCAVQCSPVRSQNRRETVCSDPRPNTPRRTVSAVTPLTAKCHMRPTVHPVPRTEPLIPDQNLQRDHNQRL